MPISELEKKWTGMDFDIAAEEMRRLKNTPTDDEKLKLYGLYKQAIHGDLPDDYPKPKGEEESAKFNAWMKERGKSDFECKEEYVKLAEKMIQMYHRSIIRSKWNSEVWSVDY